MQYVSCGRTVRPAKKKIDVKTTGNPNNQGVTADSVHKSCSCHNADKPGQLPNVFKPSATSGLYYCPMFCEGEKTYDKPGLCPVCNMHLQKSAASAPVSKVIYTCPMHPEITQDHPGTCPKCGMDLVPQKPVEENDEDRSYKHMLNKFRLSLLFSIPLLIIAMSDMLPFLNVERLTHSTVARWLQICTCLSGSFLCRL